MTYQCHRQCHAAVFAGRRLDDGKRIWVDANPVETTKNAHVVVIVNAGAADEDAIVLDVEAEAAGLKTAYREHRCGRRLPRRRMRMAGTLRSVR